MTLPRDIPVLRRVNMAPVRSVRRTKLRAIEVQALLLAQQW